MVQTMQKIKKIKKQNKRKKEKVLHLKIKKNFETSKKPEMCGLAGKSEAKISAWASHHLHDDSH